MHMHQRPTRHFSGWTRRALVLLPCRIITFTVTEAQRRHYAIPLHQAAQESPTLARLVDRVRASSSRYEAIRSLLPAPLRSAVQAGPIEEGHWCLLVSSNAVAAKLRQFIPSLQMHLESKGLPVTGIRIKVQSRTL
jgi:hypothetical protein